LVRLTLQL